MADDSGPIDAPEASGRRPLATRSSGWVRALARWLVSRGVRPNAVSIASVVFAAGAAAAFLWGASGSIWGWVIGATFIQLRLLANLLDGLLAVEGGLGSVLGDLYNEFPDRVADIIILVGLGHAAGHHPWGPWLGWGAATMAVLVAYVRAAGASLTERQDFVGPMAKPHRMAAATFAALVAAAELALGRVPVAPLVALALIAIGGLATAARRTVRLAARLRADGGR